MEEGFDLSALMNMGSEALQLIVGIFILIPFVYVLAFYIVYLLEGVGFLDKPAFRKNEKKGYINILKTAFSLSPQKN